MSVLRILCWAVRTLCNIWWFNLFLMHRIKLGLVMKMYSSSIFDLQQCYSVSVKKVSSLDKVLDKFFAISSLGIKVRKELSLGWYYREWGAPERASQRSWTKMLYFTVHGYRLCALDVWRGIEESSGSLECLKLHGPSLAPCFGVQVPLTCICNLFY